VDSGDGAFAGRLEGPAPSEIEASRAGLHRYRRRPHDRSAAAGNGPGRAVSRGRARPERVSPAGRRDRAVGGGAVAMGAKCRDVLAGGPHPLAPPVPLSGDRARRPVVRGRHGGSADRRQCRAARRVYKGPVCGRRHGADRGRLRALSNQIIRSSGRILARQRIASERSSRQVLDGNAR
jgi:hypothetical protein